MYPGNQDDSTRRMPDQGGRAWSETGYRPAQDGSGYPGGGYGGGYPAGAHDGGYDREPGPVTVCLACRHGPILGSR